MLSQFRGMNVGTRRPRSIENSCRFGNHLRCLCTQVLICNLGKPRATVGVSPDLSTDSDGAIDSVYGLQSRLQTTGSDDKTVVETRFSPHYHKMVSGHALMQGFQNNGANFTETPPLQACHAPCKEALTKWRRQCTATTTRGGFVQLGYLRHYLQGPSREQQAIIALAAFWVGGTLVAWGSILWDALCAAAISALVAYFLYFHDFQEGHVALAGLTRQHPGRALLAISGFVLVSFAGHLGAEGVQALLGCGLGALVGWGVETVVIESREGAHDISIFCCTAGSLVGIALFSLHRKLFLATATPVLGGLLVASGTGVLISQMAVHWQLDAGWLFLLPSTSEPWYVALTMLPGVAGPIAFVLYSCWALAASLLFCWMRSRWPIALLLYIGVLGTSSLTSTGLLCGMFSWNPKWIVASDKSSWSICGGLIWAAAAAIGAWCQLGFTTIAEAEAVTCSWVTGPKALSRTAYTTGSRDEAFHPHAEYRQVSTVEEHGDYPAQELIAPPAATAPPAASAPAASADHDLSSGNNMMRPTLVESSVRSQREARITPVAEREPPEASVNPDRPSSLAMRTQMKKKAPSEASPTEPPKPVRPAVRKPGANWGSRASANSVRMSTGKVTDVYDVDSAKLGEGAFGSVSKCVNKFTHTPAALKTVRKAQLRGSSMGRLRQEISIMKKLDHPNIIKLYESFEDHRNIYLVLELCLGGELFDRIIQAGHFTEVQAAIAMRQLFRGIYYMHENQICHRDLKPENLLLAAKDPIERNTLKIIDFGFARQFRAGAMLTTKAGTAYYISPQVLDGKYDQSADLWSCGVIMFVLLCGKPPFNGTTEDEIMANVRKAQFRFSDRDWRGVSDDAKSLVSGLLQQNPKERCTAERALRHVWIMQSAPRARDVDLSQGMVENLRAFKAQNKLKKAALHIIASQMNESQIHQLRETFMTLDDNGDGLLTAAELRDGMAKAGFSEIPADLQQILEAVDSNASGVIDYTEFLAATLDKRMYLQEDICWAAFRKFDRDGNGKISKEELALVLQDRDVADVAMRDLAELLDTVDSNGDGEIDFQEFMQMMTASGEDGPS